MKKILLSLVAVVLSVATLGLFTACNNSNTSGKPTKEQWVSVYNVKNYLQDTKINFTRTLASHKLEVTLLLGDQPCGNLSLKEMYYEDNKKTRESHRIDILDKYSRTYYFKNAKLNEEGELVESTWDVSASQPFDYTLNGYKEWINLLSCINFQYLEVLIDKYDKFTYEENKFIYSGNGIQFFKQPSYNDGYYSLVTFNATDITVVISNEKLLSLDVAGKYIYYTMVDGETNTIENDMALSYTFSYEPQLIEAPNIK